MMPMLARSFSGACAVVLLCLVAGCDYSRSVYEIELWPKGDQMERTLVVSLSSGGTNAPPDEELAKFAEIYPETCEPDQEKKRGFVGTFGARMPDDVGGRGSYVRVTNRMGSAYTYVERFRGSADEAAEVEHRRKAAATEARLSRGWCEQEFGREPGWGSLREFIDRNLAHDLLAISLLGSKIELHDAAPSNVLVELASLGEIMVRVSQYLLERDYITTGELSKAVHSLQDPDDRRVWVAAVLGRKLGLSPSDPALGVITDTQIERFSSPSVHFRAEKQSV
jgi:hypothetical protein